MHPEPPTTGCGEDVTMEGFNTRLELVLPGPCTLGGCEEVEVLGRTNPARIFLVEVVAVPRLQDGLEAMTDEELEEVSCQVTHRLEEL